MLRGEKQVHIWDVTKRAESISNIDGKKTGGFSCKRTEKISEN